MPDAPDITVEYETDEQLRETLAGVFKYTATCRAKALTMAELLTRPVIGEYDERVVRLAISELRLLNRIPIASSSAGGYFLATTRADRTPFKRELIGRIVALAKLLRVFEPASAAEGGGQMELDFTDDEDEDGETARLATRLLAACGEDEAA